MKDLVGSRQHGIWKKGHGVCGGGKARGGSYPSQHTGVLVMNFSLNDAVAERVVIDCGRNRRSPSRRRIESSVGHAQRSEHLTLAETVQRFVSNALEREAKNDKTNVTVCGLSAG